MLLKKLIMIRALIEISDDIAGDPITHHLGADVGKLIYHLFIMFVIVRLELIRVLLDKFDGDSFYVCWSYVSHGNPLGLEGAEEKAS